MSPTIDYLMERDAARREVEELRGQVAAGREREAELLCKLKVRKEESWDRNAEIARLRAILATALAAMEHTMRTGGITAEYHDALRDIRAELRLGEVTP